MTRLRTEDIVHIADSLPAYEEDLAARVGHRLIGLACNAVGVEEPPAAAVLKQHRAQIVPVDWGSGLIPGFTAAVAAILSRIGLTAAITPQPNVRGLMTALESPCDIIFISDDDDFTAFNLKRKSSVHNSVATGRGFAAGLDLMAGGISGCDVLVIGCGPVGINAVAELIRRGARVSLHDADPDRLRSLPDVVNGAVTVEQNLENAIYGHRFIVDATPAADLITAEMIGPETIVAAPGMPLGLTTAAVEKIGQRLLHDPLQIGVATMAITALGQSPANKI